jgi:hypothetical protein
MIQRIGALFAFAVLLSACAGAGVGFDYRVASRDPKVSPAQILTIVNRALEPAEGEGSGGSARASAFPKVDASTGEISFGLGAIGGGKTQSIRNTEARLLKDLRYEFGDRVEVFCNGERLRPDGTVEPRAASAASPPAQEGVGLGP